MKKQLLLRLGELGITPPAEDERLLENALKEARLRLLAAIGHDELPGELKSTALDMAAGAYLLFRKSVGKLDGFDQEHAVRQISQGDTSLTYAIAAEQKSPVDALIEKLGTPPAALVNRWRRLRW